MVKPCCFSTQQSMTSKKYSIGKRLSFPDFVMSIVGAGLRMFTFDEIKI